jgi:O-antigen ligase
MSRGIAEGIAREVEGGVETREQVKRFGPSGAFGVFALCAVMVVFAPIVMGGNRPLPLLALEVTSVLMLGLALLSGRLEKSVPRAFQAGFVLLALTPFLQLIPVPFDWWIALPGRAGYGTALDEVGAGAVAAEGWRAISVVPVLTEYSAWAILPPLAMLAGVLALPAEQVRRLVWVFIAMTVGQAILGLMQYGDGPGSWLRFGPSVGDSSAIGTFPNRNLFAGLLVMGLPVLLALLAACVFGVDRKVSRRHGGGWLSRLKGWGSDESGSNRSVIHAAMALVVLLGIVFSKSRSGIGLSMLVILLSVFVLGHNLGGRFSAKMLTIVTAGGLALATVIGLAPVLARFGADPLRDVRWEIFEVSWRAVMDFFPLGSGAGTYPQVIAAKQGAFLGGESYINHAHNDYLEWWVEGGLLAMALTVLFAVLYAMRWRVLWAERNWQTMHMMQVGAGLGVLMVMLHGLTDFTLRIPANQIYFALLAGVFMHPDSGGARSRRSSSTDVRRRSRAAEGAPVSSSRHGGRGYEQGEQGREVKAPIGRPGENPFAG